MKKQTKKISFRSYFAAPVFLCVALLVPFLFCSAQTAGSASKALAQPQYYSIPLVWNTQDNTLKMKDGAQVTLTTENLTKDTGSGSQFYAFITNAELKYAIFDTKTKSTKYFLGRWKLPEGQKEGEVKATIPYFVGASKVYILNSETNKIATSANVFELSGGKTTQASKKAVPVPQKTNLQANQISNRNSIWGWVIIFVVFLIIVISAYFIYRWRKRKNMVQVGGEGVNIVGKQ